MKTHNSFLQALKIAEIGLWKIILQSGKCLIDKRFLSMLGLKKVDFEPNFDGLKQLINPEDLEFFDWYFEKIKNGEIRTFEIEFRIRHATGKWKWGLFRGKSGKFKVDGTPSIVSGIIQDITDRKNMLLGFEKTRAILEAAISQSPVAIQIFDAPNLTLKLANDAAVELTGVSREKQRMISLNTINERTWEMYKLDGKKYTTQEIPCVRTIKTGEIVKNEEMLLKRSDGKEFHISVNAAPIRNSNGEIIAGIVIFPDLSEYKKNETERIKMERQIHFSQRLESLGLLAGGIAHDFNNFLTAILGHTDLVLLDLNDDSPARANLLDVKNVSFKAADLCKQLLAYSGKGKFSMENFDLNGLISEITGLLKTSISKKAVIGLRFLNERNFIKGDPAQIRQVIMNLVLNASDALENKPGEINIFVGEKTFSENELLSYTFQSGKPAEGNYIEIKVEDTGIGMPPEVLSKVFEPFFSTKAKGRGLGMSSVLGIVRAHNGGIFLESYPGKGSSFSIIFPPLQESDNLKGISAKIKLMEENKLDRGTILVVDDEEKIRDFTSLMLKRTGFEVLTASNGKECLELYQRYSKSISCIILDFSMPVMDGEETLRELLLLNNSIKVIATSGYVETTINSNLTIPPSVIFLKKPFQYESLIETIRKLLA
ncbi:MAG: PAS domain S-box protein [Candidatus Riflebacteria bacterium]|nr:PAS domain S-box protein [Candidatus Riflebacteria bacterium]